MEISLNETASQAANSARASGATAISERDAKVLLRAAGIAAPQGVFLQKADGVTEAALAGLRRPLVAKVRNKKLTYWETLYRYC